MIRIFLPLICAALGLMAASCSQSADPFAPAAAPASSSHPDSHSAAAMAGPPDPQARGTGQSTAAADQAASGASQPAATSSDPTSFLDAPSPPSGSQASAAQPNQEASTSTPPDHRASGLIGMPVVSANGSPLGEVKDIVFDRQGRVTHLVIAYGIAPAAGPRETLDAGKPVPTPNGKLTAMPWDAAVASIKSGRLVLESAQLQSAPSFTPDAWPNLDNPTWSASSDAYWRKAVRAAIAAHPGAPIDATTRQRGRPARDGY
ncbi:MAG TPA: PRC-barrel domain-containing protein [Steroidobacteraceae bacterium]